jgi:hypothetical protein
MFNVDEPKLTELERNRVMAILSCYGVEAYKNNKVVTIEETGEIIKPWHITGVINVESLKCMFSLEMIISLYDVAWE